MKETKEKCTHCGKTIIEYKTHPIVNWTNIEQPNKTYLFCSKPCKMVWLAERLEESQNIFKCKYCNRAFDTNRGKWTHEGRCKDNPKVAGLETELYIPDGDNYTIEDLRKIDRILGPTDGQIARFVRGSGSGSNK